jgi:hypothetical protein
LWAEEMKLAWRIAQVLMGGVIMVYFLSAWIGSGVTLPPLNSFHNAGYWLGSVGLFAVGVWGVLRGLKGK